MFVAAFGYCWVDWFCGLKCSCSVAGCRRLCVSVALLGGLGLLISWFDVGLFIIYCLVTWCGFVLGLWCVGFVVCCRWWVLWVLGLGLVRVLVARSWFWIWCF